MLTGIVFPLPVGSTDVGSPDEPLPDDVELFDPPCELLLPVDDGFVVDEPCAAG